MIDHLSTKTACGIKLEPIFFKLGLTDKQLLIYAVIYQFTVYGAGKAFTSSLTYLQQFSNGTSRQGVLNTLNSLRQRGYITKFGVDVNGKKTVIKSYSQSAHKEYKSIVYTAKEPGRIFDELDAEAKAIDLANKRADVERRLADIKARSKEKQRSTNFSQREYSTEDTAALQDKLSNFSATDI